MFMLRSSVWDFAFAIFFENHANISKVMYVVMSIKKTTTPIVVVLPTLSSARITDGPQSKPMV